MTPARSHLPLLSDWTIRLSNIIVLAVLICLHSLQNLFLLFLHMFFQHMVAEVEKAKLLSGQYFPITFKYYSSSTIIILPYNNASSSLFSIIPYIDASPVMKQSSTMMHLFFICLSLFSSILEWLPMYSLSTKTMYDGMQLRFLLGSA